MVVSHDTRFAAGLAHLDEFIAEHGHANVTEGYRCEDGFNLGSWVNNRRRSRRAGRPTPSPDQVRLLDDRAFDWNPRGPRESGFEAALAHLDDFIAEHGHANVPYRYRCEDGYTLGAWVRDRRSLRRAGQSPPSPDQVRLLDDRGFDWNPGNSWRDTRFAAGLARLDDFVAEYGHSNVPSGYRCVDGYNLGTWVSSRRSRRRVGHATPTVDQVRQLDERGFDWNPGVPGDTRFAAGLARLDEFIAGHGHANVPREYKCADGFNLGVWVTSRRASRRAGRATPTPDQIRQLDERGFDWNPATHRQSQQPFDVGLAHLDEFIAEYGHATVPDAYQCPDGYNFGKWVGSRRSARRAGRAIPTPDQIRRLDERGFDWNPATRVQRERAFKVGVAHLEKFVAEHGHADVPLRYRARDGFNLGAWVNDRR
ncbi:helicase associated domain-containing protein [Prescottella agglutinans]|uniref:Helicase-associated domain-containing protein n=1 Tax=Prescottella agglutinans TaxID=1644129 RepID=A0ABT6MIX8_9NOCA|nr:helicase associated domain-containing protein [Prescottella agglutinans]MDH6284267.1 hypothetical protein [Prescottella agglutinans]